MFLASFWCLFAYFHIAALLALCYGFFIALWYLAVAPCYHEAELNSGRRWFRVVRMAVASSGSMMLALLSIFLSCSYMLWFHGDYMLFHRGFFDTLFALPNIPDLSSIALPNVSWEVLKRLLNCEFMAPILVLQFSIAVSIVEAILKVVFGFVEFSLGLFPGDK